MTLTACRATRPTAFMAKGLTMTSGITGDTTRSGGNRWRIAGWGFAAALLATPFVAMQFTREVNWTAGDFVFAAIMFGLVGGAIEFAVRASRQGSYRLAFAVAVLASFLMIWVNLAVGIVGNENEPVNQWFFAIVGVFIVGSFIARARPRGMTWVMIATAAAQVAVGLVIGLATIPLVTLFFTAAWLGSAWLFRLARAGAE
jgi:hypothetical protein